MTKHARINDRGQAVDVTTDDPATRYPADLAATFVVVPDEVENGWTLDGETWVPRPSPSGPAAAAKRTVVNRVEFKQLFTIQEQVAIRMARAYSGSDTAALTLKHTLDAFYDVLDDSQLVTINLAVPMVVAGLAFLEASGLIAAGRAAEIGEGVAE